MQPAMSAVVRFAGKMRFSGQVEGLAQEAAVDYPPPLGDGKGWSGLQLLLLSLAACSGQSVAVVLARGGHQPARLEVRARGTRRAEHPTVLTAIDLEFVAAGVPAAALERAVKISEETLCPVWAMLKGGTAIRALARTEE